MKESTVIIHFQIEKHSAQTKNKQTGTGYKNLNTVNTNKSKIRKRFPICQRGQIMDKTRVQNLLCNVI